MTMTNDLKAAQSFLEDLGGGAPLTVLCAASGGMDSMCLLHLLAHWGRTRNISVTAAHFNHRLRGAESDGDEAFVRSWCAAHAVPFVSDSGDVAAYAAETGESLEEAARALRYSFLERQRQALGCDLILTAHHADDLAETMLLNLLRGTGIRGLAGIPELRQNIARPFLALTRETLTAYAQANAVPFVEDSTNAQDNFSRNLLRHKVLPVLREVNPRAVENMARAAAQMRRDEASLSNLADALLERTCREESSALYLDAAACLAAEKAVLSRAVHGAMARVAGRKKDLTAAHVEAVCDLLNAPAGKSVSLPYGLTALRTADGLEIVGSRQLPERVILTHGETAAFGDWYVTLAVNGPGMAVWIPKGAEVTATLWDRNDRMTLPGSRGARSLKRLCGDAGISVTQRSTMPVLRVDGQLAAVPGVGVDEKFAARTGAEQRYVIFHQETEEKNDEK